MAKLKKQKLIFVFGCGLFLVIVIFLAWPSQNRQTSRSQNTARTTAKKAAPSKVNPQQYPIDQASSLWVVVNKGRVLPSNFIPPNLVVPNVPLRTASSSNSMHVRGEMAAALEQMLDDAKSQGINLMLTSGYRSYIDQVSVYNGYVKSQGMVNADTFSARPGHSEHQTGLAADVEPTSGKCELDQCFGDTPEGKWLYVNSYKYGLIIRYQKDAQQLTGYEYEPWHVRYVGKDLAAELYTSHQTLEQFFGLPIYTTYPEQMLEIKNI